MAGSSKGTPIDLAWLLGDGAAEGPNAEDAADKEAREDTEAQRQHALPVRPAARGGAAGAGAGRPLGDLMEQSYERVGKSNEPIGPVLVVVDEAGNWPLSNLPGLASTCAGIGIQLILVYQSKAQIDAGYGRMADATPSSPIV
ncbi:MAG: type secretion system protein VirD4 [Acidimicrobiaceae bacterium]|nr:type secretion system protein VirD4 [Acidimicrobiaceae bacterium]